MSRYVEGIEKLRDEQEKMRANFRAAQTYNNPKGMSAAEAQLHGQLTAPTMTLRDWFAGQALGAAWQGFDKGYYEGGNEDIAACAYQIADAMIAEGKK